MVWVVVVVVLGRVGVKMDRGGRRSVVWCSGKGMCSGEGAMGVEKGQWEWRQLRTAARHLRIREIDSMHSYCMRSRYMRSYCMRSYCMHSYCMHSCYMCSSPIYIYTCCMCSSPIYTWVGGRCWKSEKYSFNQSSGHCCHFGNWDTGMRFIAFSGKNVAIFPITPLQKRSVRGMQPPTARVELGGGFCPV